MIRPCDLKNAVPATLSTLKVGDVFVDTENGTKAPMEMLIDVETLNAFYGGEKYAFASVGETGIPFLYREDKKVLKIN